MTKLAVRLLLRLCVTLHYCLGSGVATATTPPLRAGDGLERRNAHRPSDAQPDLGKRSTEDAMENVTKPTCSVEGCERPQYLKAAAAEAVEAAGLRTRGIA